MVVTRNQSRLVFTSCDGDARLLKPQAVRTGESSQETNPVTTTHIPTSSRSISISSRTSRSSAMITARKLAAEAQHARHVARLEMELTTRKFELERNTAELEHQAEIAAIEASSSHHGTKSGRSRAYHTYIEADNSNFDFEDFIKTQYKLDSIGITKHEPGNLRPNCKTTSKRTL
ncbi:hypothetical protein ACJJTC_000454 [Scirpophaga incertulas]